MILGLLKGHAGRILQDKSKTKKKPKTNKQTKKVVKKQREEKDKQIKAKVNKVSTQNVKALQHLNRCW